MEKSELRRSASRMCQTRLTKAVLLFGSRLIAEAACEARAQHLAAGKTRIRTALGLHPQLVHDRKGELPQFERLISETRYVGEVGLDGGPEFKHYWEDQVAVFTRILNICRAAGGRVMSLHSRRAAKAVLDALENHSGAGTPILHWFSGSNRELARAIDLGCWFSVGPAMLRGEKGRELTAKMPRDRLLTESDGPFAQVAGRSAWPWEVGEAIADLGTIWGLSRADTERQLLANLSSLGRAAGVA
ncbi:Qat anti-phage system TatD family nuclease QatD [Sphingomonas abietis]|uniref:TatD family hydrolase n=1 Tax=Sphingomonas abietis TaxID=3012344 RepID=A0ABY7NLX8_9SPHN|nr:Qat anti-phage system TatD family nuclease QatD [Sphingomonas abietis]WBO20924.1 TatD family hydrolase [Sphingomonas abietis]